MSCCGQAGTVSTTGVTLEEERVRAASRPLSDDLLQTDFHLPGVHCIACIRNVERRLSALAHVANVRGNLSTRSVRIDWDPDKGNGSDFQQRLDAMGYRPALIHNGSVSADAQDETYSQLLICLGVAGFAAANVMLLSVSVWSGADAETAQLFHLISGLIAVPAAIYAGRPFFSSAFGALAQRRLNMDVPISLAVILALGMSVVESLNGGTEAYFDAAVMLLFFLLIGRTLDHMMRERARHAVKLLAGLAAKGAVRIGADGMEQYVDASEIKAGDRVRVNAGERIPVDGVVRRGRSDLDRALVTGESASVAIDTGDLVESGTMNLTGPLEIEATKAADDSFVAQVISMMAAAENGKARFVRIADRAACIYAPAVHLLALGTFVAWLVATNGDWQSAAYTAIAVLIITCPCALGLAVPIVHVIGASRLFERGILMKDGTAFEKLTGIDTVIFDKTGTLTMGRPEIVETRSADAPLGLIAALAASSSHPAAQAIVRRFEGLQGTMGVSESVKPASAAPSSAADHSIEGVHEVPGYGVEGTVGTKRVRLGQLSWVADITGRQASDLPAVSTVWFAEEGKAPTCFVLEDALRPDARESVARLQRDGLHVEILSGDVAPAVDGLAALIGISDTQSGMKPADKIAYIKARQREGKHVLMVGDGLNDAPALTAAHASMAPASASDVGRQAADFVFTSDSLTAVPFAFGIAKRTDQLVKQNIGLAVLYNCIAVPLAAGGFVTPLVAAIAMSLSSVVVVANSLRLRWVSADETVAMTVDPISPAKSFGLQPATAAP